ncbi:hypothetical protein ACUP6R_003876 [Vibrio navarrensis]
MDMQISYIIVKSKGSLSYFNEFDTGVIESVSILEKILTLPQVIAELFSSKEQVISDRLSGLINGYRISFIDDARKVKEIDGKFKVVFIGSSDDIDLIDNDCVKIGNFELLNSEKVFSVSDLSNDFLLNKFNEIIDGFNDEDKKWIDEFKEILGHHDINDRIKTDINIPLNLYTKSNIGILDSIRVDFDIEPDEGESGDIAINLINYIKGEIKNNIHREISIPTTDYYLSDFSNNLRFLINKSDYKLKSLEKRGVSNAKLLLQVIKLANSGKVDNLLINNPYIDDYARERNLFETLVSIAGTKNISPNLKLSIGISQIYSILKDIGITDRIQNARSVQKLRRRLVEKLDIETKDVFEYLSDDYSNKIKIVSNLPLEWSSHASLPLMIRHEVSRIPQSPGYLTTHLLLDNEQVILTKKSFQEIQFISSFKDGDPIKNELRKKIQFINDELNLTTTDVSALLKSNEISKDLNFSLKKQEKLDVSISWNDVANKSELIDCLNKCKSAITVFDMHGGHDEDGNGYIMLKDGAVFISELIGKVNVSPIVILSCCDTNPIDRNHFNTANAFLCAGAKTVLASALPIISHEASVFLSRLLLRVKYYLPVRLSGSEGSLAWSSFVSGVTRKQYYNELLTFLYKKYSFDSNLINELNFFIGLNLDPLRKNWHDTIVNEISKKTGILKNNILSSINQEFVLPECLKYIQIGNPESVIIVSDEVPLTN